VAQHARDKKYDRSIEGFTLVAVPADSKLLKSWIAINPHLAARAANGSPAHAWAINLRTGAIQTMAEVKDGQKQFAAVVKQ
jgi:hypothetical protein